MVSSARTSLRVDRLRPLNVPRRVEVRFETDSLKVGKSDSRTVGKFDSLKVGQSDSGDRRTDGQTDRRTEGTDGRTVAPRRWGVGGRGGSKTDPGKQADSRADRQSNRLTSEANRAACPSVRLPICPSGKDIPIAIEYNKTLRSIEAVLEIWRVDDEWWRDQIARRYIEVVLEGGKHVVLFEDLLKGTWFVQEP